MTLPWFRYNHKQVAKELRTLANWYEAGACDTSITDLDLCAPFWIDIRPKMCVSGQHFMTGSPVYDCTCVSGPSDPWYNWPIELQYSGQLPSTWVRRWIQLPPNKRPSYGEWSFLREYHIEPRR